VIRWTGFTVLAFLLILISGGCAPGRRTALERTLTPEQVIRRMTERSLRITTMRANGHITIESPEESMTGSFDVRIRKPDSLRVEFGGPFGIHVATLSLSRSRFVFYNWHDNSMLTGTPDEETLRSVIHLKLGFDEILNAFTGDVALPPDSGAGPREFSVEDNDYVFRYHTPEGTREYHIDGDEFIVTGYRMLDSSRHSVFTALASDLDRDDGIAMPRLLRIIFPAERRSMTLSYGDFTFNEPVTCAFTLPRRSGGAGQ